MMMLYNYYFIIIIIYFFFFHSFFSSALLVFLDNSSVPASIKLAPIHQRNANGSSKMAYPKKA
jgi:hypothetical protein